MFKSSSIVKVLIDIFNFIDINVEVKKNSVAARKDTKSHFYSISCRKQMLTKCNITKNKYTLINI